MRERASTTLGFIVLVAATCTCGGDAAKRELVSQAATGVCNGADSLMFGDLKDSPENGGLAGSEIILRRRHGVWAGRWRGAGGGLFGPFEELQDVEGDSIPGPFSFSNPWKRDTTLFRGRISCDSLVGEVRYYRSVGFIPARYLRTQSLTRFPHDTAAVYRDSTGLFDPDGYYLIKDDLMIEGRHFSDLQLHTIDYYYEGQTHYERPKLVQPPEVNILLSAPNDRDSRYPCTAPLIIPDTLSVRCIATPIGDVSVDGHFLDKTGWYWNKLAYEKQPTVLLTARVVIIREGRIIHDAVHNFTYSAGD